MMKMQDGKAKKKAISVALCTIGLAIMQGCVNEEIMLMSPRERCRFL